MPLLYVATRLLIYNIEQMPYTANMHIQVWGGHTVSSTVNISHHDEYHYVKRTVQNLP